MYIGEKFYVCVVSDRFVFQRGVCVKLNDIVYMIVYGYEILLLQFFFFLGVCDCDIGYIGDDCLVVEIDFSELDSIEGGVLIDISVGVVR